MKKVIDYDIIVDVKCGGLADKVKKCLKEGWQPYGYPFIGPEGYRCQAIVKYEECNAKA
jgi:hypothetical protein